MNSDEDTVEDGNILDEAELDDQQPPIQYNITSFGVDYDVDGLVKRLKRGDIFVPHFQREYVWNISEASRFIESLLLGLPVPGVFLAKEQESNKLLIIDGQQRLMSLLFFYEGFFNPQASQSRQRVFKLSKVQPEFEGLKYDELDERDRIALDDSTIHATVISQESPKDDDTSIYHVFERLNTGGKKLSPQEIRSVAYHGTFISYLSELNEFPAWRKIYGKPNTRLKDQELILRFLAMAISRNSYVKPMSEFLNKFVATNKNPSPEKLTGYGALFAKTITLFCDALGEKAFRPERGLNAAVFDSVMVGVAMALSEDRKLSSDEVKKRYQQLIAQDEYKALIAQATSDEANVKRRCQMAIDAFGNPQ